MGVSEPYQWTSQHSKEKGQVSPLRGTGSQEFQWLRESVCLLLMASMSLTLPVDVDCQDLLCVQVVQTEALKAGRNTFFLVSLELKLKILFCLRL